MAKVPANQVFANAAQADYEKTEKDRKRKSTERAKQKRRQNKYARIDNSHQAKKAHVHQDDNVRPEEVVEDVSPEYLEELKMGYYETKVMVSEEEACAIERDTREQYGSELWKMERKMRITASAVGSIAKMRQTTKRGKKVESILYSTFKGTVATRYGTEMESEARKDYIHYQTRRGHAVQTSRTGLVISVDNPWLAASPDDRVIDQSSNPQLGLVEYKNPYSARTMTVAEACQKIQSFCLEKKGETYQLKRNHDYHYQVQCQLYCNKLSWCDFVLRTEKELFVERIQIDPQWWNKHISKLKQFYFEALLPELACPRHNKGGIRE